MKYKLFQLYDVKSETYTWATPHTARGQAIRSFTDSINNKSDSMLHTHPEDFTLFEVGEFDASTGEIKIYDAKQSVANGLDVKISV